MPVLKWVLGPTIFVAVLSLPLFGQQRDAQLIDILTRTVRAAGGPQAVVAVHDITETGEITFYWGKGIKGPLTIQMLGGNHFRMEADLPDEKQTWILRNGVGSLTEKDRSIRMAPQEALNLGNLTYPLAHVVSALADPETDISFAGIERRNDRSVYRLRVKGQLGLATKAQSLPVLKDLLIDALDFDIVGVEDHPFPSHRLPGNRTVDTTPREIEFADFRVVEGLRVPFLITTKVHEQKMLQIRLSEVHFNTNLTDEQFKW
jgi:hypothetical protein